MMISSVGPGCAQGVVSDLIRQAESLSEAGNLVAAAMTARLAIESQVRYMAAKAPAMAGFDLRNAKDCATMLHCAGIIDKELRYKAIFAYGTASRAAHGDVTRPETLRKLVQDAAAICRDLAAAKIVETTGDPWAAYDGWTVGLTAEGRSEFVSVRALTDR